MADGDLVERGVGQVQVRAVAAAPPLVAGAGQGLTDAAQFPRQL